MPAMARVMSLMGITSSARKSAITAKNACWMSQDAVLPKARATRTAPRFPASTSESKTENASKNPSGMESANSNSQRNTERGNATITALTRSMIPENENEER